MLRNDKPKGSSAGGIQKVDRVRKHDGRNNHGKAEKLLNR